MRDTPLEVARRLNLDTCRHLWSLHLLDFGKPGNAKENVVSCAEQVVRLSSQDVPTAYAYELEAATIVQPEQVLNFLQGPHVTHFIGDTRAGQLPSMVSL